VVWALRWLPLVSSKPKVRHFNSTKRRGFQLGPPGGGALAVADLMCVSGASNTVLEVQMPYSRQAMAELLGGDPPSQYVRSPTSSLQWSGESASVSQHRGRCSPHPPSHSRARGGMSG
jgi:hypothetical protein